MHGEAARARPDLAVGGARSLAAAIALQPAAVIAEGRAPQRPLRAAGYEPRRYLALPSPRAPEVLIPLDRPRVARYALRNWTVPRRRWKAWRNRLLEGLVARGAVPATSRTVTVGARAAGPPFLVAAAGRELELPRAPDWFLALGEGDALTRGVFHLFRPAAEEPEWVLKFARVPGYAEPFERDRAGLERVRETGEPLAGHAPRLLARFAAGGLEASVETAAAGARLAGLLQAPGPRAEKLAAIERVAAWLVEVARATATAPDALAPERERLARETLTRWRLPAAAAGAVAALDGVPAVFEHRDLGSWNVISAGARFTAVDWESSCRHGFPLWDLLYFLADSLAHVDGASPLAARAGYVPRLFRGEAGGSPLLFRWVGRMSEALALPDSAVGPLATLCWLHHGASHLARAAAVGAHAPGPAPLEMPFEAIARAWLDDPELAGGWGRRRAG